MVAAIRRVLGDPECGGKRVFLAQTATLSPQECLGTLGKPALSVALISAVLLLF